MRSTPSAPLVPALVMLATLAACASNPSSPPQATATTTNPTPAAASAAPASDGAVPQAAIDEAKQIFSTRCFACHGPEGKGDGPASAGLVPHPRNFTDAAWQASVTDEHIETIVKFGGAAVGKSAAMPNNPDLIAKPDVVKALRMHVRELGEKHDEEERKDHE